MSGSEGAGSGPSRIDLSAIDVAVEDLQRAIEALNLAREAGERAGHPPGALHGITARAIEVVAHGTRAQSAAIGALVEMLSAVVGGLTASAQAIVALRARVAALEARAGLPPGGA